MYLGRGVFVCGERTHRKLWLCFESQHSYYGFHVACKVLSICFDQSLFGMPSHIKMLGIHLLRTNKPCKALFLKHEIANENRGLILNFVVIIVKD